MARTRNAALVAGTSLSCLFFKPKVLAAQRISSLAPLALTEAHAGEPTLTFTASSRSVSTNVVASAHDHRYEGLAIGAVLVGGAFAVLGNALCQNSDSATKNCTWGTVKVGLVGVFVGGLTGAMIGSAFPERAEGGEPQ